MRLYSSNRVETLAAELARLMRADPGEPFAPERVVVPHPSLRSWLSLELAHHLDVTANVRFEQPATFAWSVMRAAVPALSRDQPFTPARLRWRLYDVLPAFVTEREAPAVRGYLADGDPRKRFELADCVARVFDRCVLYRPDWIREWERGAAPHWQARLWRRLVGDERPAGHWVAAIDAFKAARTAEPRADRPADWPRRASFFAVPALSPSYLDLLSTIDREIDVHLFMLDPCREYWGDISSRHEIDRRSAGADPEERYFTEGNELLAAWGQAGRDTLDAFVDVADGQEYFEPPEGAHRLAAVQRDVLDLRLAREGAEADHPALRHAQGPADDSIQIHVCHSSIREAEVLHDRLLGLFDAHPDLQPADVLVLTPNPEVYGPAIEAVFGAADRMPFSGARPRPAGSRSLRAFLDLLALADSRFGAEAVLAPLDAPAVRARFGLDEADLPILRARVRDAGIRWGADEAQRQAEGLPATADHTWRQGIRRLLLGYAVSDTDAIIDGLVPCPADAAGFGGGTADDEALGRFLTYCDDVFGLRTRLAGACSPEAWAGTLRSEIDRFFIDGSAGPPPLRQAQGGAKLGDHRAIADETDAVRGLIREFQREAQAGTSPIPFTLARDVLRAHAREAAHRPAQLADGVTVARLAAGCIFPAQVVCVVGLNDGTFPRSEPAPSFDVVAAGRARRGDRDVRHEDRFAFLEALLAARRSFILTYTGRSLRDDAPIPPAVPVDEFKEYLVRRFPASSAVPVETRHPLQPFSPRYFAIPDPGDALVSPKGEKETSAADANLFSYAQGMCAAAEALLGVPESDDVPNPPLGFAERAWGRRAEPQGAEPGTRLTASALPEPDASRRAVTLAELIEFFANPARFFLRERLGIRLELDDVVLHEDEPFALDALDRYRLRSDVWDRTQSEADADHVEALLRGSGRLPHAALGRVVHEGVQDEMEQLTTRLAPHREALDAPPRDIDFEIDGFRVTGTVEHVGPDGLVWWRIGSLRAQDRIEIWLRQLAWAAAGHDPVGAAGIGREKGEWKPIRLQPPDRAGEQLAHWLRAWWRGLASPLPFFPETSFVYANKIVKHRNDESAALSDARERWFGNTNTRGERLDPYLDLIYGQDAPLTGAFAELATDLLAPLVLAGSKPRAGRKRG